MGYNAMMTVAQPLQLRTLPLLNTAVYFSLILLITIGFVLYPHWLVRVAIALLCLLFGLTHQYGFPAIQSSRQAHSYFAIQLVLITLLCLVAQTGDPFNFPFYILSVQAMLLYRPRVAAGWIAAYYVVGCVTVAWRDGGISPVYFLFYLVTYLFVAVYGYTLRQAETSRQHNEQLLAELQMAQAQLQTLAVAEERNRLARDLHDSTKQQAFALSAQLGAARSLMRRDPQTADHHLQQAEQLADRLREELAALILDLRPPALVERPFPLALRQYVNEWSQTQAIPAQLDIVGERPLPAEVEGALFRIVQEALTNIGRHSQAHSVALRLVCTPDQLILTVQDDGQGFEPQSAGQGIGLHSMRERAQALPQGALILDSVLGQGTRITVQCRV
jgi:signal transduction histidine kinase